MSTPGISDFPGTLLYSPLNQSHNSVMDPHDHGDGKDDTTRETPVEDSYIPPAARPTSSDHISLKVVSQDGNEVYFKIKKTTELRKLMDAYCERQAVQVQSIRFLYDGQRINPKQTPESLDMTEDDIIDAVLQQTGGMAPARRDKMSALPWWLSTAQNTKLEEMMEGHSEDFMKECGCEGFL